MNVQCYYHHGPRHPRPRKKQFQHVTVQGKHFRQLAFQKFNVLLLYPYQSVMILVYAASKDLFISVLQYC